MAGETPVAPWQSCIGCLAGDTPTCVVVEGEAEYHIAVLMALGHMDQRDATATISYTQGCRTPGLVPDGRFSAAYRICRECVRRAGAPERALGEAMVGRSRCSS